MPTSSASAQRAPTATFIAGIRGVTTGSPTRSLSWSTAPVSSGPSPSSRRVKNDIHDLGDEPGLYQASSRRASDTAYPADGPLEYGLIAEEVAEIYPELVVRDADGQPRACATTCCPRWCSTNCNGSSASSKRSSGNWTSWGPGAGARRAKAAVRE